MVMQHVVTRASFRRFAKSKDGSATVEAVLWLPVFLVLLSLVADTSALFGRKEEILRIVQTANRALAVGYFKTPAEAQVYIGDQVRMFSSTAQVLVSIEKGIISSTVDVSAADLTMIDFANFFSAVQVSVSASQMLEV